MYIDYSRNIVSCVCGEGEGGQRFYTVRRQVHGHSSAIRLDTNIKQVYDGFNCRSIP